MEIFSNDRVETLVDGVYAIAMTILVLAIEVPDVDKMSLTHTLVSMIPIFGFYLISFFILSRTWINKNMLFKYVKHADSLFTWLNLLSLMFVALVPFSTMLIGKYPQIMIAEIFFHSNLLVISLITLVLWKYVVKSQHLWREEGIEKCCVGLDNIISILVPLLGIVIACTGLKWGSTWVYILIPVLRVSFKRVKIRV